MSPAVAPPSPRSTQTELHLSLELASGASSSALLRVVSTLHRRRCRVVHASFRLAAGGRDELDLVIEVPRSHAGRVEHWLRGLVDVRRAELRSTSSI
jgi:hypothetical protein